MAYHIKKDTPSGDADACFESETREDENPNETDHLTSVYDGEIKNFNGFDLYHFLIECGFNSFLPYLSIILRYSGFSLSQIGTLFCFDYLISAIFAPLWFYVTENYDNRHGILMTSSLSWIIFAAPLIFIPFKNDFTHQKLKQTNFTVSQNHSEHMLLRWHLLDYEFLLVLSLIIGGRIFQSSTDYYYSNHQKLLQVRDWKTSTSGLIWSSLSALFCVFVGRILDTTDFNDHMYGNFKSSFYIFAFFVSLSCVILVFLEVPPYTKEIKRKRKNARQISYTKLQKCIICLALLALGLSRGIHTTFLYLHMNEINSLFLQIGLAFLTLKLSENTLRFFQARILKQCALFEILLIALGSESIINLYYGYTHSQFESWFIILNEIIAGTQVLLNSTLQVYFINPDDNNSNLSYIIYWGVGVPFGTLLFGFSSELWSIWHCFQLVALTSMICGILVSITLSKKHIEYNKPKTEKAPLHEDTSDSDDDKEFLKSSLE